jgi:hypothetical protein
VRQRAIDNRKATRPYEDRPVGCPEPPDLAAMSKEEQNERREIVSRLDKLTKRVEEGEEGAMPALREILKENPDLAWRLANFARAAENVLLKELARRAENPVTEEAMRRQFAAMREEIAGDNDPSPLERLLAERIVTTWMQVQVFESICISDLQNLATSRADHHQRHLDRAHRRHLSAVRTLAQVRKLLKPGTSQVAQINIAGQQINTAGGS